MCEGAPEFDGPDVEAVVLAADEEGTPPVTKSVSQKVDSVCSTGVVYSNYWPIGIPGAHLSLSPLENRIESDLKNERNKKNERSIEY